MRVVRSPVAHGKIESIDAAAALALPGVHAVWTSCRRRAHSADRFPADRARRRSSPTGSRCWRTTSCAMSASRWRWCFADDPYLAEDAADLVELDDRASAGHRCDADRAAGLVRAGRCTEPASSAKNMATSMPPSAPRMPLSSSSFRSAATPACRWKRAAPSRATTKRATFWKCTAPPRCRTGIATRWRRCLGATARIRSAVRGPCRRRLRHPRRDLSGGRAGLRRRAEIPAGRSNGSRTGAST